ncbi:MAG: hypothetical protein ACRDRI_25990 [Pseudonocardiaceae bacterium]
MSALILGVVNSLAVTALTTAGGWVLSTQARQWAITLLSRFTGLGIQRIYQRQKSANVDMPTELSRARWVKVLAGRGNELTRDGFISVWTRTSNRLEFVQVLLPNPSLGPDSWLARREEDIQRVDPGIHPGLLAEQVHTNASYILEVARRRGNVALRFYDLPNIYRVIVTDNVAYLTIYSDTEHGRNSPCIAARRPGLMYDLALLLFSTAWNHGQPAEEG